MTVAAGAEIRGIDIRLRRTPAGLVTGQVGATDPALLKRPFQVVLRPTSPDFDGWPFTPQFPGRDRTFRFPATPGSYLLLASAWDEGPVPTYTAQQVLDLKEMPPDPVHLVLERCPDVKGTVEVVGENAPPLEGLQVVFDPIDSLFSAQPARAQVGHDGAFTLAAVAPGRWRLSVPGQPYMKSPDEFEVPRSGVGPLKVVVSTKTGQLKASASSNRPVTFVLVRDSGQVLGAVTGKHEATFQRLAPGRYRLYAFEGNPVTRPDVLKALEGRARQVEIGESQTVQATTELIRAAR